MTKREFDVRVDEKPRDADMAKIVAGLRAFNARQRGAKRWSSARKFAVYVERDGEIVGGLVGITHLDWLYVDYLWIDDAARGRGFGRRLMDTAERVAARHGCLGAWLDTMSFQAPGFYRRLGYRKFGELADLTGGATRYWLWKRLERRRRPKVRRSSRGSTAPERRQGGR
jgi:ribosomal protein S18 acetylase RimI-like enzyme